MPSLAQTTCLRTIHPHRALVASCLLGLAARGPRRSQSARVAQGAPLPRRGQEPEPAMAHLQPALALGLALCLMLVLGAAVQGASAEMIERTAHLESVAGESLDMLRASALSNEEQTRQEATKNYTYCDPLCVRRGKYVEGFIIFIVTAVALVAGLCCMQMVDTPSAWAPAREARRPHMD